MVQTIALRGVVSCVRADFAAPILANSVVVRARSVTSACGVSCTTNCNTGPDVTVFGSSAGVSFFDLRVHPLASTYSEISIPNSSLIRTVLACRSGYDRSRDHVEVDFIGLCP